MFSLIVNIPANVTWKQNGVTIAGGHGEGGATNQLYCPGGLFVDDDQTVVIADYYNHRIMQWKNGDTTNGQVVAGGKCKGNGLHQLDRPIDVLIDKETDSLIICDKENRRVVQWSRRSGTTQSEILIDNINCYGLAMDEQRYLYVSDVGKHEVRRYQLGEKNGTLVAGGNGKGDGLNQLNLPTYLVVDRQQNVYVSDNTHIIASPMISKFSFETIRNFNKLISSSVIIPFAILLNAMAKILSSFCLIISINSNNSKSDHNGLSTKALYELLNWNMYLSSIGLN
ncbi:unnamed protein product [Rotaria socialis]